MRKPKVELNEWGFPAFWWERMLKQGKPSQQAYNNAIAYIESQRVDLHQEYTEGYAYEPQVLVGLPGLSEHGIKINEDGDLGKQITVTEEQTVV